MPPRARSTAPPACSRCTSSTPRSGGGRCGIHRRLRPGAPLVTFHHSVPTGDVRRVWLARWARFTAAPGTDDEQIAATVETLATRLPILAPEEDEALLRDAGFRDVGPFYGALTFRGWVASA